MAYIDNVTNILQIQPDGLPTFVRLSQNENGRNLYFQLAGNEIDIPANATITISGTKPDGTVYSGTGSISDNVILIPEMIQMTAVAGYWDAKVKIISGGNTIATGRIRFVIDADTVDPDSVPSDSELEGLVAEAQQYAETARTEAYGSPLTAQTVAGMTDHTRVYVYIGSESGYTAGHWYFWNGSAWTDGGIYNSTAVNTDTTLTLAGVAADAKATGDAIEAARVAIDDTLTNEGEAADAAAVGSEISGLKEDLTNISDDVDTVLVQSKYLKRTATTVSLTWTEGGYYNFAGDGSVISLSTRAYSQKIDCREGDIIIAFNNKGQICFWNADGTFNSYKPTDYPAYYALYIVPSGVTKYAFNNIDSSIRMASCTHYSDNDSIVTKTYEAPAKLIYDSTYFTNGRYASTVNGKLSNMNSTWNCGIMLPCEPNHKYRTETQTQIVFYDSSMTFISAIIPKTPSYTGKTVEMDFTTPANTAYMSINSIDNVHEKVFDLDDYTVTGDVINPQKLHGKTVVCFGDSITGNYGFGDNYPYQIERMTGAKTYNCGFGGCRMELINNDAQHTNPFSMCGIVDALEADKNGDITAWNEQDEYAESISKMVYLRLQILKAVDWNKVDIVTIAYGTNEGGYPQDDEENPTNKYTYGGATRYAVNKLLTLYPHLRIVLLTPIYRFYTSEGVDSDTHTHPTYGGKLTDNVETLIKVGGELKIPVLDLYHTLGINITNYATYFGDEDEQSDGTHINSFGREQMGRRVAGELNRLF